MVLQKIIAQQIAKKAFKKKTPKKRQSLTHERDGYKFAFDDERLQSKYIATFEDFRKKFPDLPQEKVISWASAKSLVHGKDFERLNDAVDIYDSTSDTKNAKNDKHHKLTLFDMEIGGKTVNNWLKNLDSLKADIIKTGGGSFESKTVRYNFVYYDRGYGA